MTDDQFAEAKDLHENITKLKEELHHIEVALEAHGSTGIYPSVKLEIMQLGVDLPFFSLNASKYVNTKKLLEDLRSDKTRQLREAISKFKSL